MSTTGSDPVRNFIEATAALVLMGALHVAQAAASCGEDCLKQSLDTYFAAMQSGDVTKLAVARDLRFTDNGERRPLRLVRIDEPPVYRLDALDPVTGQAACNAVVIEDGRKAIVFVRLAVANGRITELETVIVRQGVGQKSIPDNLTGRPVLFADEVPVGERMPRAAMVAAANAYLTALESSGTDHFRPAPLARDLVRVENGWQTSGMSRDGKPPLSVAEQLATAKPGRGVSMRISDRRFPLVDERHGIALGIGIMHLDLTGPDMPGLHSVSKQNRIQALIEFFKVSGGEVHRIQAVMLDLDDPAITSTGW